MSVGVVANGGREGWQFALTELLAQAAKNPSFAPSHQRYGWRFDPLHLEAGVLIGVHIAVLFVAVCGRGGRQ